MSDKQNSPEEKVADSSLFEIKHLGPGTFKNPISLPENKEFIDDAHRIARVPHVKATDDIPFDSRQSFELSGPREKLFFNPEKVRVAIVTCGGLCPGINAVIRGLVLQLWSRYGCRNILGIRYGYQGFGEEATAAPYHLTPELVSDLHQKGGSFLGSSRGTPGAPAIVDALQKSEVDILFTIGGDGTMRGALAISEEIEKRGLKIGVVGIPKTIDNDISLVRRSFGFETAVGLACQAVESAYTEAIGGYDCIGLVRLMGRNSGYIAASATLATGQPDFCLVPEIPFGLDQEGGLFSLVEDCLDEKRHALVVVAEGAGQGYFDEQALGQDPSGNTRFGDIGLHLKNRLLDYFREKGRKVSLKYIDPSYIIRSAPANPADRLFCAKLAQNAVHAAMAGKTAMLMGYWHGAVTHIPLKAIQGKNQSINPQGELWFNVLETTGQPVSIRPELYPTPK